MRPFNGSFTRIKLPHSVSQFQILSDATVPPVFYLKRCLAAFHTPSGATSLGVDCHEVALQSTPAKSVKTENNVQETRPTFRPSDNLSIIWETVDASQIYT